VRCLIQKQLVDRLALALLEGRFHAGESVLADAHEGEVALELAGATA
jgi:ATP-dependent Clp protease ATP-binding subunit ClpA